MFSRPIRLRLDPSRGSSSALSNSENTLKGKATGGGRIKTENYFFVPFGLKLIFTAPRELPALLFFSHTKSFAGVWAERAMKGARWMGFCFPSSFMPSAPMILNVNERIKFLFLFYFHIVFLFPAFSLGPGAVVVCFSTSLLLPPPPSSEAKKRRKMRKCFPSCRGSGGECWLFCASAEKYGLGLLLVLLLFKREESPQSHSTARHKIKFL